MPADAKPTVEAREAQIKASATGLVKALGFIAWSDEILAPEETEMLATVMGALGLGDAAKDELHAQLMKGPPTLDEIASELTDALDRRFALAQAIIMAFADGEYSPVEQRDVERLAARLEIGSDELAEIHDAVALTYQAFPEGE